MARRGLRVSSPSTAAVSNPVKERIPKAIPAKTSGQLTPAAPGLKASRVFPRAPPFPMMTTASRSSVATVAAVNTSWVRVENSIPNQDRKKYRTRPTANHSHHWPRRSGAPRLRITRLVKTPKPASTAGPAMMSASE